MPPVRRGLGTGQRAMPRLIDDPDTARAVRNLQSQLDTLSGKVSRLIGPDQRPTGPTDVEAIVRHSAVVIVFRPDAVEVSTRCYIVWRAYAGTTAAPTTPSAADAYMIGTVVPTWKRPHPGDDLSFTDLNFTDPELTVPLARFMYWVSTLDTRDQESPLVPIAGGPATLVA